MKLKGIYIFILVILNLSMAQAENLSIEQAQNFLHLSGLQQSIDSMPQQFEQQVNLQRLLSEDIVEHEKAGTLINEAVAGIDGQGLAINYLTTNPKAGGLSQAITFLESDLGKTIVVAESKANDPEFQVAMQAYAHEMATNNSTSAKRLELIQQLIQSLHVEEVMLNMVKGMMFSTLDIFKAVKPEAAGFMETEFDKEWQNIETVLKAQLSQYMVLSMHYTYRDISDQDLSEYMVFLQSKNGQVYWGASIEIFNLYLGEFIKNFTNLIIKKV